MFLFILGVLLALVGVPAVLVGNKTYEGAYDDTYLVPFRWIGAGLLVLAGALMLLSGAYTQDPGEAILIRGPGGSVSSVDTSAGFGFTAPWNAQVKFDIRNQKIEMFSNNGGNGDDGAAISAPTAEGTDVKVSITARYSIRSDCIESIYEQYRSENNLRERALRPGLRDEVRIATAQYSAFEIKQRRGELTTDIVEQLTERWDNDELCVSIDDVDLGDLALDEQTEAALRTINERQSQVESARADLERAQIEAEVVKTEAQADQAADQIIRCGATVTTETREVNGQPTEVDVVTPVPVDQCQNLLNEQVLVNNYIEALREIGAGGNLIVVSDDVSSILNLPAGAPQG